MYCRINQAMFKMSSCYLFLLPFFLLCFSNSLLGEEFKFVGTATLLASPSSGSVGIPFSTVLDSEYLTTSTGVSEGFQFVAVNNSDIFKVEVTSSGTGTLNVETPCLGSADFFPRPDVLQSGFTLIQSSGNPPCELLAFRITDKNGFLNECYLNFYLVID